MERLSALFTSLSRYLQRLSLATKAVLSVLAVVVVLGGTVAGLGIAGSATSNGGYDAGTTKAKSPASTDMPTGPTTAQNDVPNQATASTPRSLQLEQSNPAQITMTSTGTTIPASPSPAPAPAPAPKPAPPAPSDPDARFSISLDRGTIPLDSTSNVLAANFTISREPGHTKPITTAVVSSGEGVSCRIENDKTIVITLGPELPEGVYGCKFTATDGTISIAENLMVRHSVVAKE